MIEPRRTSAVFCGENPQMLLYATTENDQRTLSAAASYWRCVYSEHGEGNVLLVRLNEANGQQTGHTPFAIYSDNAALGRWMTDTFNRHMESWKDHDWRTVEVTPARFFQESDSRYFHRVACISGQTQVEATWVDPRTHHFLVFPDLNKGGFGVNGDEHYDVYSAIFSCAVAHLLINGQVVIGEPNTRVLDDGRFSSSAFMAFAETWVKSEPVTG
ncbi:MAG: hypothetical protein SF029_07140 [bacterium]|nr:hypothetical protein [bacterium]